MDKISCKQLLEAQGWPVVEYETVTSVELKRDPKAAVERLGRLPAPIFVKPSVGGSSVGVSKVEKHDGLYAAVASALRFDERFVVERGIAGRELECTVLGYRKLEASPIGEIIPSKTFYDYADKYLKDGAQLLMPAQLDEETSERLRSMATSAFAAIGGWGMARVDFFLGGAGVPTSTRSTRFPVSPRFPCIPSCGSWRASPCRGSSTALDRRA